MSKFEIKRSAGAPHYMLPPSGVECCEHGLEKGLYCALCVHDALGQLDEAANDYGPLPDHFDAAATVLEAAAARIRRRESVEEVAADLLPMVRVMARRT